MSVQVKTPTHNSSQFEPHVEPAVVASTSTNTNSSSSTQRRRSRQSQAHEESNSNAAKRRRYSASRGRGANSTFYRGGTSSDPLNLSSLEGRTVPSPAPSPHASQTNIVTMPRINNITDPLNLTIDADTGEAIGPLSPTGPVRYKRKRMRKKVLQKLEIDFHSDEEGETGDRDKSDNDVSLHITDDVAHDDPLNLTSPLKPTRVTFQMDAPQITPITGDEPMTSTHLSGTSSTLVRSDADTNTSQLTSSTDRPHKSKDTQSKSKDTQTKSASHTPTKSNTPNRQKSINRQFDKNKKKPAKSTVVETSTKNSKNNNKQKSFIHGNYNQYYGYRSNDKLEVDPRIQALKHSWVKDKAVLDIGCNIGHVTLTLARDYSPHRVVGVDIDAGLISIARKNIRYYRDQQQYKKFPQSLGVNYGPISCPASTDPTSPDQRLTSSSSFPHNVSFVHANYCLESDALLDMVQSEFDVILALSVTKWMHLNNGDEGLKRCFKRMYLQLNPGGLLILEPQMWPSYKKRKHLTAKIKNNFNEIVLKPDQFTEYLLSPEIGFTTCERLNVQEHQSKGFRRPLYIFRKSAEPR